MKKNGLVEKWWGVLEKEGVGEMVGGCKEGMMGKMFEKEEEDMVRGGE